MDILSSSQDLIPLQLSSIPSQLPNSLSSTDPSSIFLDPTPPIDPKELREDTTEDQDPQELNFTPPEIESLSQFAVKMDGQFTSSNITNRSPPSSPTTSSSTNGAHMTGTYYMDARISTPLTGSTNTSSTSQWNTQPTSSFQDNLQSHYNYPQVQTSNRSHSMPFSPELRYTNDYTTQPRTGHMIPHLDLHSTQLQFPVNNSLLPLQSHSPAHHQMPPLFHQQTHSHDLGFPAVQQFHQSSGTKLEQWDPSVPRFPVQQHRSHSYPDGPVIIPNFQQETLHPSYPEKTQEQEVFDQISVLHKQEQFSEDDIRTLKSLLSSGERVKWRYISSRLSSITGRRTTSATCAKKTKEMFKLPSDKASGSLGSSLAYVVHNSWDQIKEDSTK